MKLVLLLAIGLGASIQEPPTYRGILHHQKDLEGGAWTLTVGRNVYDLHGNLEGFAHGDPVEIQGTPDRTRLCHHMVGIVFRLKSIRKVDEVLPCK